VAATNTVVPYNSTVSVPTDSGENGVCMDQFVQLNAAGVQQNRPNMKVGLDYISNHDGASTTLLMAESLLTSRSLFGQSGLTTAPRSGSTLFLREYAYAPPAAATSKGTSDGAPTITCYFRPSSLWTSGGYNQNTLVPSPQPLANTFTTCIDTAVLASGVVTVTKPQSNPAPALLVLHCELDLGFEWGSFSATPRLNDKVRSRHSGGIVVSFCDGHQQFLSDNINVNVYKQLMTPWGDHAHDPNPDSTGVVTSITEGPVYGVLDEASY
jgi:prepilin-type processing-associated H-X9-DG protein